MIWIQLLKSTAKDGFVYLKLQILGIVIFQLRDWDEVCFTIQCIKNPNQLRICNIFKKHEIPKMRDLYKATTPKTSKLTLFFIKADRKLQKTDWSIKRWIKY